MQDSWQISLLAPNGPLIANSMDYPTQQLRVMRLGQKAV